MTLFPIVLVSPVAAADPPPVVSVSDISQEFSFYMDGRFHKQYLKDFHERYGHAPHPVV